MRSAQLPLRVVARADFFRFGGLQLFATLLLMGLLSVRSRASAFWLLLFAAVIVMAAVGQSHAASRLTHREILLLTAAHGLGVAGWIGAMLFLLLALRKAPTLAAAQALARQYSGLALVSVPVLVLAGVGMSLF